MPNRFLTPLAVLVVSLGAPTPHAHAQDAVETIALSGRVIDARGLPIPSAEILIAGVAGSVRASDDGRFRISGLMPGLLTITVRRLGFSPSTTTQVAAPGQRAVEIRLSPLPHALAAFRVTARPVASRIDQRMESFNARRARGGGGTFITRQDIVRLNPRDMTDLLRLTPGFRTTRDRREQLRVSSRGNSAGCLMRFVLDGVAVEMIDNNLNLMVRVEDVEAAEFYRGASTAPVEFSGVDRRGNADCGLIVVWTRQK